MDISTIHLKDLYPGLDCDGADPTVTAYIQQDFIENDCKSRVDTRPRPALIICPGGGYHFTSFREAEPIALAFAPLGFNCFVLHYSVAPIRYPQALREVTALVDLIHRNRQEWSIDTDKIVINGYSAGGHLAASYCTIRNRPEITSFLQPHPVCAAILGYPVIAATPDIYHGGSFLNLLGTKDLTPQQISTFSLEKNVTKEVTPPTFLWHTASDATVNVAHSLRYAEALSMEHIPFEMHIFPIGRHGLSTADRQTVHDPDDPAVLHISSWVGMASAWLKQFIL